jgi:hypothetical protein
MQFLPKCKRTVRGILVIGHVWELKLKVSTDQTTFETYNKPCFECAYLVEDVIDLLKQKVAPKVKITLGCFICSKVAQLVKSCPILPHCTYPVYK